MHNRHANDSSRNPNSGRFLFVVVVGGKVPRWWQGSRIVGLSALANKFVGKADISCIAKNKQGVLLLDQLQTPSFQGDPHLRQLLVSYQDVFAKHKGLPPRCAHVPCSQNSLGPRKWTSLCAALLATATLTFINWRSNDWYPRCFLQAWLGPITTHIHHQFYSSKSMMTIGPSTRSPSRKSFVS